MTSIKIKIIIIIIIIIRLALGQTLQQSKQGYGKR